MKKIIKFIIGYAKFGQRSYKYLFIPSLIFTLCHILILFIGKFDKLNAIGLGCFGLFFGIILIEYIFNKIE